MVKRRHDPETKFLDLTTLAKDPEINNTGMFDSKSREAKFFPALMAICETIFPSGFKRREAVVSVSLASNDLPNVAAVTTLAQTFPNTKNLDLSNNHISDLKSLEPWRRKFRYLEHLILTGNPIENVPDFHLELMKWYPNLRLLNGVQVRSEEEFTQSKKRKATLPVQPALFRDQDGVAENFIKQFFPAFDNERAPLIEHFYGPTSTFSLNIDTQARATNKTVLAPWDSWIKKSRNQMKITSVHGRKYRIFKGVDAIRETWLSLPATRHPDPVAENEKWCIECQPIPGLPDPTGSSPTGVGGLMIVLHGELEEHNKTAKATTIRRRSFDRAFILGPGNTPSGIQVLNDIWTLRAYGGYEAFKPTITPQHSPASNKTPEQVQQELLALELSRLTNMTLEYSVMCLQESDWDLKQAGQSFETNRAKLPPTAFIGITS